MCRSKLNKNAEDGVKKPKKAVKKVQKEKLSTMSNESNTNLNITNDVTHMDKVVEERKEIPTKENEETEKNAHFNLRKRKKINYSVTRPDFVYESLSDSEYEDHKIRYIWL